MSAKTRFITKQLWNRVAPEIRSRVEKLNVEVIDRYVANVESDLRTRGENVLADDLLDKISEIGPQEPVPCAVCGQRVSFGDTHNGKVYCPDHSPY